MAERLLNNFTISPLLEQNMYQRVHKSRHVRCNTQRSLRTVQLQRISESVDRVDITSDQKSAIYGIRATRRGD